MGFKVSAKGKYKVITLEKGLEEATVLSELQAALNYQIQHGTKDFILDFSKIKNMNSLILGVLSVAYRKVVRKQGTLNVILKDKKMEEVFNLSGFNLLVKVVENEKDLLPDAKTAKGRLDEKELEDLGYLRVRSRNEFIVVSAKEELKELKATVELYNVIDKYIKKRHHKFIFDFKKMTEIPSGIIGCISHCYQHVKEKKGEIYVIADQEEVRNSLNLSGMASFIDVYKDYQDFYKKARDKNEDVTGKTILIVSGNARERNKFGEIICDEMGHAVKTAKDSKDALKHIKTGVPDLIIMDIKLADVDGCAACRQIKRVVLDRYVPVIFITDKKNAGRKLNALEAGADDFISRPVSSEDLFFRVNAHLKISELNENLRLMNETLEKKVYDRTRSLLETEGQLYQTQKMSAISTMLSGIAHELRNPIFVIGSSAQMLRRTGGLMENQIRMLKNIEEQSVKCSKIVDNILQLVRKKSVGVSIINLNEVIRNMEKNLGFFLTNKEIKLEISLDAKKAFIKGSPVEIEQVIVNLVSNAADSIKKKGTITVRTCSQDKECLLEVEDNGAGIPGELQKKIFDPFFTTKEAGQGTGLGLSITYKIIQSCHGRLEVESELGKGAKFKVYFPTI